MSYCLDVNRGKLTCHHKYYHDNIYGFPCKNDNEIFGRLVLEINQAGLSWDIILKKEKTIKKAYKNYSFNEIAKFDEYDIKRILNDKGAIRMRRKVIAIIYNAKKVVSLTEKNNSFKNFLDKQEEFVFLHPIQWHRLRYDSTQLLSSALADDPQKPLRFLLIHLLSLQPLSSPLYYAQ